MELRDFLQILVKRMLILISLPLLSLFATYAVSTVFLTPVYQAKTTVYVISKSDDLQSGYSSSDLVISQQLVKDYQEFIKSRVVIEAVMTELGLENTSYENLAERITVKRKNESRILEIVVNDTNPTLARDIAQSVTTTFREKVIELMNIENVNILDEARIPEYPISPDIPLNLLFSFFTGLFAAIGLIFLLNYLDSTIKDGEDVEKYLKLKVLGSIPVFIKESEESSNGRASEASEAFDQSIPH